MNEANTDDLRVNEQRPTEWFEPLYAQSNVDGDGVPWANMGVHPHFATWLASHPLASEGDSALVVGCGLGDDAIELERRGFQVTAFDVASSAIELCKQRFSNSTVDFVTADLFEPPSTWSQAFDFVLEIYTVQALPPKYEHDAIRQISHFVAPGGKLLVAAEVARTERLFENGPPWLLTPEHVQAFGDHGLKQVDQIRSGGAVEASHESYITCFQRPSS